MTEEGIEQVSSTRLVVETLLHTALLPGAVIVLFPYLVMEAHPSSALGMGTLAALGAIPATVGLGLLAWCTWDFLVFGRGTPNPLDPPRFLVRGGPYAVVRNPMYVAVGLIVIGEAIMFDSRALIVYAGAVMVGFHLFVVLYEEPFLRSHFGADYEEFCRQVNRWIPRFNARA